MRILLVFALAALLSAADEAAAIQKVLNDQAVAWNKGDLEEFMKAYLRTEDITFMGKNITRGYDAVLKRYQGNYGNKDKMGTLRFEEIEVRLLGRDHALVLGRFYLARNAAGGGDATGRYTLVGVKTKDGWRFIHDHTS